MDVPLLPDLQPRRLAISSHQLHSLLTGSWYSLYSLRIDSTENSTSNSSFVVGWRRYPCGPYRKHCSSVACAVVVTLMSCLLYRNLVITLSSVIMSLYITYNDPVLIPDVTQNRLVWYKATVKDGTRKQAVIRLYKREKLENISSTIFDNFVVRWRGQLLNASVEIVFKVLTAVAMNHIFWEKLTDVSEEHIASIFRAK
jgi:hypothetical protein